MARTSAIESALGGLVDRLADRLADRISSALRARDGGGGRGGAGRGAGRRRGRRAGRKLDMTCRVAGCKNRSRGPRFGFICDDHRKSLSKKEQLAAREAWKSKNKGSSA